MKEDLKVHISQVNKSHKLSFLENKSYATVSILNPLNLTKASCGKKWMTALQPHLPSGSLHKEQMAVESWRMIRDNF